MPRMKLAGMKQNSNGKPSFLIETHKVLGPRPSSIEMIAAINIPVCLAGSLQGVRMDDGPREALPSRALSYSHLPVSGLPDGAELGCLVQALSGSVSGAVRLHTVGSLRLTFGITESAMFSKLPLCT